MLIEFERDRRIHQTEIMEAVSTLEKMSQSPELVTEAFRKIWLARGERSGMKFEVPDLTCRPEDLIRLGEQNRRLTYVPPELTNSDWIGFLEDIFPNVGGEALPLTPGNDWAEGAYILNVHEYGGWISVETSLDAPYPDTTEDQLRELFRASGQLVPMRLPTYIIASYDSRLFTGYFFDENTWSRLLYSYVNPIVSVPRQNIHAGFNHYGRIRTDWGLTREYHDLHTGARTEELIQTQLAQWTPWGTLLKAG